MNKINVTPRRYFMPVALPVLVALPMSLIVLSLALDLRYGSNGSTALVLGSLAVPIGSAVWVALFVPAFTRKPSPPPNYPRIEHLRIAGKYNSTGSSARIGVSPLRLT